jgi:hypothetical protein
MCPHFSSILCCYLWLSSHDCAPQKELNFCELAFIFQHNDLVIVFLTVQVAFKTGDYKQQVIFIGGLTDGFLATEYVLHSWSNPLT